MKETYEKENENKVFDDDLVKTIFYARSDLILQGRPVDTICEQINRGRINISDCIFWETHDELGKRVRDGRTDEECTAIIREKIDKGEIIIGPAFKDDEEENVTTAFIEGYFVLLSGSAMEECGLTSLPVEYYDGRTLSERVRGSFARKDVLQD